MFQEFWPFLFACTLVTSIISAVVGMSGGVILLVIMSLFMPFHLVIPLHGTVQLFSNGIRAWLLRKSVRKDFLIPFLLGIPLGLAPALWIIGEFHYERWAFFFIATLIVYSLFRPKKWPPLKMNPRWFFVHGIIAAFFCLFVGAVGPFLAPFFIRDDLSKEEVVSTKAGMQTFIHLVKIPSFFYLGFSYGQYWPQILILTMAAWIGTKIGIRVLGNLDQRLFEKLFKLFLSLAAIRLYYKVFV
ncbi:MAG: sulfite exporter TauE/SafE family protein [Bacteriovoracales bacterium]|nr:sulfite exporter TauE/SafE family protein [Bacteriovoracales bacterium]